MNYPVPDFGMDQDIIDSQTHEKKAIEKFEGKPAAEKAESAKPEKKPAESAAVTT
jgi:hypothetical protein